MKISELIARLQEVLDKHDDLPVELDIDITPGGPVECIFYDEWQNKVELS